MDSIVCGNVGIAENQMKVWLTDGKQMLMLFNENVVDLKKFMEMKEGDSLQEILA